MNKDEQLIQEIKGIIEQIDSRLFNSISDSGLDMLINIALSVVDGDGLEKDKIAYGAALIVLNMLSEETKTNISSKKIKDVAITMGGGYGVSKYKIWYDALKNGELDGEYALRYQGIG